MARDWGTGNAQAEAWWNKLTEYERLQSVMRYGVAEESAPSSKDLAYMVEKPWKWIVEAYEYAQKGEE